MSDHCAASRPRTTMCALSQMKFGLSLRCRCGHKAERTDGIYRLIGVNAVNELVEVHIFTCIIEPHQRIPNWPSCTA